MKTQSEKLNKSFDYEAKFLCTQKDANNWEHDAWLVIINGQKVDYKTGLGLRMKSSFEKGSLMWREPKPTPPKIDDVIYSLLSDYDAGQENFNDFCSSFGYDTDSRKAFDTYLACQESGQKFIKLGINLEDARKAFENY